MYARSTRYSIVAVYKRRRLDAQLICFHPPSETTEAKLSALQVRELETRRRRFFKCTTMKVSMYNLTAVLLGIFALFLITVDAAPMEPDDEQSENMLVAHPDNEGDMSAPWDSINPAALRKLLLELDAEERLGRATRSWPQAEPRGWSLRNFEGRLARPWRADKRQVRFRQCYFNPISCFRK